MGSKFEAHILVLDDEPFMLKLLVQLLVNAGFKNVTSCDSGQAGLDLVDQALNRPELILCDLNMPGMDGVEFIRRLVEHGYPGCMILVSGEDERTLQAARKLVQAHHIEILGSLRKPVSPQKLTDLLAKWVPVQNSISLMSEKQYGADRLGLAIREKELINYYQPIVSVATGEVDSVETLVRWLHPQDGLVFPDRFIGIAETHGLIDALTRNVLEQSLVDVASWNQQGLRLKVAINISMVNLNALDFPEYVSTKAIAAGIPPQLIMLEVTESQLMHDLRAPLEILMRLRLRRFGLSIDDFGTGHSSLVQLRDLPFEELKIDQSFVHGAHANETNRAIFFASLRLAKELGMSVVAEGVEDQADWRMLMEAGCGLAQGYYIARPMPASQMENWMEDWKDRWNSGELRPRTRG